MANLPKVDSVPCLTTPENNKQLATINFLDDDDDGDDSTPLRPIFCLKRKSAIKEYDDKEDCFILDFNPEEDIAEISVEKGHPQDSPDIFMVAEKGQVACRDYPHSRHLCVKHPFQKTPHESHCKLCYCYVCDIAAPCNNWTGLGGHCHAIDNEGWRGVRDSMRKGRNL